MNPVRFLMAVLACFCAAAPAFAQESGDAHAELVFHNRPVFTFRASLTGFTPAERAQGALRRIQYVVDAGGPGATGTKAIPQGVLVTLDGRGMFAVTDQDVDRSVGETPEEAAAQAASRLQASVAEARELLDARALLLDALLTAAATGLFAVVLWTLSAVRRRVQGALLDLISRREGVKVAGVVALQATQLSRAAGLTLKVLHWVLALLAAYIWVSFCLEQFPYTRPWGEQLRGFLIQLLLGTGRSIAGALPGLAVVAIIVLLTRLVVRVASAFFARVAAGRLAFGWLDADTAGATRALVTVALWLFALAMAYPYLPGAGTDAFKGLSVLVGLMISIGGSSLVGQAASGLILIYSKALRPGEFVVIGETEGTVTELGMFATRVATGMCEEVILPNSFVLSNVTRNFSRRVGADGFVLHTSVTIGYSTPWRQVHAMLLEAARRTRGVLVDPKPYVIQTALSDFYVEYRLVASAGPEAPRLRAEAMSTLHANVQDVFNEHGVQIMSPHYMTDPQTPQVVPKELWYTPPAKAE